MECIGDPLSSKVVMERILRPMVKLTREKQEHRAKEIVRYTVGKERAASQEAALSMRYCVAL